MPTDNVNSEVVPSLLEAACALSQAHVAATDAVPAIGTQLAAFAAHAGVHATDAAQESCTTCQYHLQKVRELIDDFETTVARARWIEENPDQVAEEERRHALVREQMLAAHATRTA